MRGNKTLTEGLINTREFINGVNNSRRDYYEKTVRFFGGGGVTITLTSLIELYVTDIDTNKTILFTTIETSPADKYNWGWDLRDALLDLEIILGRSNWRKELGLEDSHTKGVDLTGKKVRYRGMTAKVLRKLTEQEKQKRAHLINPDAGDYYEIEIISKVTAAPKLTVWEGELHDSLTEDANFYGTAQGSEKADDILFALQVMYGEPRYTYRDFQKMNLSQTEIKEALEYVKKKGYNKHTYFDSITEDDVAIPASTSFWSTRTEKDATAGRITDILLNVRGHLTHFKNKLKPDEQWEAMLPKYVEAGKKFGLNSEALAKAVDFVETGKGNPWKDSLAENYKTLNDSRNNQLEWLLNLPEGYLVAISACVGTDCTLTDTMESMLRVEFDYIKVVGKWDGIEETSFLVFTENENMAKALVQTGIYDFNQEDVYVWKTPMTMADITEGTNEGTRLDDKYYYFDLDKIVMKRENVIMENKNGKALNENRGNKIFNSVMFEWVTHPEDWREYLYNINIAFEEALDGFFVDNIDIPIAEDYTEWVTEWNNERVEKTIEKELRAVLEKLYPDITLEWASVKHTSVASYLIISLIPEGGDWTDSWTEDLVLTDEDAYADFVEGVGLTENKTLNEREGNKMSIEQRVISVLDELSYLDKIREHAYNYYYNKSDYRDKLDPDTIEDLITSAQSGDLTDAWIDLTSNFDDAGYVNEYITNDVVEALEKVAPLTDEEFDEVNQLLWDFIQIDYSTYLDDEVSVHIMVDTGDGNYDFTLNPNYSFNWDDETVEDEPLELASLTWLAGTQGYTLDQVLEAFREGGSNNKFLNSVVREGLENNTSMTAVTFLGTMRILDLLNAATGNRDITINADTYVGLFDTWHGSGSLFDIELEKGLVIPGNIINRIGTAKGRGYNGYTPDQVYGFSGSVYDSKINLLNDLDRDVLGESKTLTEDTFSEDANIKYYAQEVKSWSREDFIDERDELLRMLDKAETQAQKEGHRNFEKRINNIQVKLDEVRYIIKNRLFSKDSLNENKTLNETEEVYYTGAIYDIENIAQDFEEDEEDVILNGLIDLRDSGLMVVYYRPSDRDIIATGTKEQFKEFVKTNKYMSEYDWHAYGGGGAMVDELIAMEALWVDDDSIENIKRYSTNLDNEIKKLLLDLPEEKINKLNENKGSLENRLRTQHFNKLIQEVDPQDIVEQLDTRDVNRAIRNRRNGGEDETGYGGLWDLAFEETLDYLFWEVGLDELTDGEHHEYALLAEGVYDILIANEEDYVIELIWEANPNVIVQQIDIRDINKAIRSRRSGGEDETGSGGLWDLAFEETLNYLYHEVGLDELTNEEHHAYTLLAEEVYNILVANEENYANGRRPILDESKTLTEDAFDYDTMHKINDYIDINEDKVERMSAKQIFEFVKKQFPNVSNIKIAESLEYVYSGSRLNFAQFKDSLTEAEITFLNEMRYKDYVIELFKDTQYGTYHWQAEYDGDDRKLSNFNVWITARGINLYSEDQNAYPTKANAVSKAKEWVDKQKRRWDDSLNENKILTEDITEDNLTIVLNYVFNTDEDSDQYGDSFLYDIDIWRGNEQLYPVTKPVYQTHEEMMNGDDYDIDYTLRQALQEAYPEYIIEYAGLIGDLYDMIAIINCLDEDGDRIDTEVPVKLEEIEDTAWDDETRLSFWV